MSGVAMIAVSVRQMLDTHVDVAAFPSWSRLFYRDALCGPSANSIDLSSPSPDQIMPIEAAPRHLIHILKILLIISQIAVDVAIARMKPDGGDLVRVGYQRIRLDRQDPVLYITTSRAKSQLLPPLGW